MMMDTQINTDTNTTTHWVDAMHLASASLPIGGFAYSQGLEQACQAGTVTDVGSANRWISDYLQLVLVRQELPWWRQAYEAAREHQWDELKEIANTMAALRETAELRLESRQMAHAMMKLYEQWLAVDGVWQRIPAAVMDTLAQDYSAAHAALCALRGLPADIGLTAWVWGWLDNQVLAAVKLVPLGQRDGQTLVHRIKAQVSQAVQSSKGIKPEAIGSAPLGLALHSMRHETQYARLFRS